MWILTRAHEQTSVTYLGVKFASPDLRYPVMTVNKSLLHKAHVQLIKSHNVPIICMVLFCSKLRVLINCFLTVDINRMF